jgi:hypothetical protein
MPNNDPTRYKSPATLAFWLSVMCPPQRGIYPVIRGDGAGNFTELLHGIVLVDETAIASPAGFRGVITKLPPRPAATAS